ncbi:hypothetical protein FF38_01076 [Lucilia cuprina]|uniref:Uncharacterized protein n=1 Tax=Lucilia cuprina TaxID=7375 RepID=A0A0L0CF10_LUCCU|nr:hypothetical protein FF38_01076 [Lucilia cuprina]
MFYLILVSSKIETKYNKGRDIINDIDESYLPNLGRTHNFTGITSLTLDTVALSKNAPKKLELNNFPRLLADIRVFNDTWVSYDPQSSDKKDLITKTLLIDVNIHLPSKVTATRLTAQFVANFNEPPNCFRFVFLLLEMEQNDDDDYDNNNIDKRRKKMKTNEISFNFIEHNIQWGI